MKINKIVGSVSNGNEAFFINSLLKKENCNLIYIARNDREIFDIKNKLNWLIPSLKVYLFRSWDSIPYDTVSPSKIIQSERIKTLHEIINNNEKKIIITSINSIVQKIIHKDFILKYFINIKINYNINFEEFIKKLLLLGYVRTSVVREKSEFAVRGSIIDIFLTNNNNPIRIDFFDKKIDKISEFDRITQKTIKDINKKILINPSSELIINEESLNLFRKKFRTLFDDYRHSQIYKLFSESIVPSGGENYISLFNDSMTTLFDYCKNYLIVCNSDFENLLDTRLENINDFYKARVDTNEKFHLDPKHLFINKNEIYSIIKKFNIINLYEFKVKNDENFDLKILSNLSSIRKEIDFNFIKKFFELNNDKKIIICCQSTGSLKKIQNIVIDQLQFSVKKINNFENLNNNFKIFITAFKLENSIDLNNYIFLTEKSLIGYNLYTKKLKDISKDIFFEEINKFTKNTILVHNDYGLCRFLNIVKIDINSSLHDCIELEFSDNQKLFLPIENLNSITKYGNEFSKNIQLDKLGSNHWEKRKLKTKDSIKIIAKKLISIAAKRLNSKSYNISFDSILYEKFSSTFPFVETDDQINAIEDIKNDFSKNIPSDRLIVGDVAFGKTEVILRAVFLASKSKIQSLVMVPTTLLSRQHFLNFSKRLNIFDIKVVEISRFIKQSEKEKIYSLLENGEVDVVIGTHALLNDKVKFQKLGLIIYDEEQKLGTKQKEKFKEFSPNAHVISLSATPIPRTLSLSLSGIRDLSLILTAPYERLSVRTFISPFDNITIVEAIKREIYGRKNSVFFVVPRKKDIPIVEKFLKDNLHKIKYVTAHGQLNTKILEERITSFYNQEVPLMVSTNIIENGLDLPHVNTIIIYRSNMFSLAGLYQLKGRVGRSTKRGYAYLTYNEKEMNENSKKRLQVINSFDEIGSGFNIASQDLELRGGGSIIGEEQSGFIKEVGTELYHQMLEDEIVIQKKKLINDENIYENPKFQPTIKIPEEIYIPDNFISDLDLRMSIYKRISNIKNNKELDSITTELIDRFGKLPLEVENLFKLIEIKIMCFKYNISQIDFGKKGILFSFFQNKPTNPKKIINLGTLKNGNYYIRSDQKIFYNFFGELTKDRFILIKEIINNF